MCDAVATVRPDCPSVPDDAEWCQMYETELLCGKEAGDIPDALVDEVLREVASDAKIPHLATYMHQKHIITNDEYQQLTSPQTSDLQREKFTKLFMKRDIQWLLEFCHCLLESYESEHGLDIHHKLFQQIKGEVRSRLKMDLPEQVLIEAEDVVTKIKSIPITQEAEKRLIQRLKLEGHRHLFENFKQVTTSDIADAWLSANKTRDWTILVEALLTEPGLGCAVSGVLPLSSSNPPAVWNYVRDIGKNWKHLASFLGYSDSLISEIDSKSPLDVKSQIRNFMRVCLIPDCGGEQRTEEIMDKIKVTIRPESQSDRKYVNLAEWKGPADSRHVMFGDGPRSHKGQHQLVHLTDMWKDHHLTTKEADDCRVGQFPFYQPCPQVLTPDKPVMRVEDVSPEVKKAGTYRSEDPDAGRELLQACTSEQWDVAEALIDSGSALEAQDKDGRTPLHICCIKGKAEMVTLLVEFGSNVTAKDKMDNCCLHHKETLKKPEVASLVITAFVNNGTSVDQANKNGVTPLMVACQSGDICSQAALMLLTHDARVDGLPNVNDKPLISASANGNTKLVEYLLNYGANIDIKDGRDGSTALLQACLCNHPGIVKVLLDCNPNVNLADVDGTTALAAAVSKDAYEMVQLLIKKGGANVNCTRQREGIGGSHEETPLASACARGYRDVAELLVNSGANVNYLCSDTVPPIGFAIICRQHHMIKFLLEVEGIDKSIYGLRRTVDIAVRAENYAAAKMLLDARGGPELALQEAEQNHLFQLASQIDIIQNLPEAELRLSAVKEPAVMRGASSQMRDQAVKVEEVLQMFSQICMSAIASNTSCEQLLEISKAIGVPSHISSFIQEYDRGIHRQDILKAKFLSSDTGMSPANYFITNQFIDVGLFHAQAMEFFPDGTETFYEELVWTFHQISGGEDLPFDVDRVLARLFSGHFSLNVRTATIGQLQYDMGFQGHYTRTPPKPQPTVQPHKGKTPKIVDSPKSCNDVNPGEDVSFSVQATGDQPLEYLWEHQSGNGEQLVDNGNGFSTRKAKGKGASNTLQKFFNTLPNQITPESIARELFAEKIISEEDVERANNQLFTRDQRAEKLLLTLIRKVKGMPEWFDTICKILEKEIGTVVEDLRAQFETEMKEIDGWKTMSTNSGRFAGVDTSTLTVSQVQQSDQGNYRCTVTNRQGKVISKMARLTVTPVPPKMLTSPLDSFNIVAKQSVTFVVKASGDEPLEYQWQQNTLTEAEDWKPLVPDGKSYEGAHTPKPTFPSVGKDNEGKYRCQVSNNAGEVVSDSAALSIAQPPKINLDPKNATDIIPCMDSVTLTVEATGVGPIEYQWERKSVNGENIWQPLHDATESFEGVKTNALIISFVQEHHEGEYRCVMTNLAGSSTSKSATLSLVDPDCITSQFIGKACTSGEMPSLEEIKAFVQKYGAKSEIVKRCLMTVVNMDTEQLEVVKAFLKFAAPCDFEQNGMTPLQCACIKGHSKIVLLLMGNGASKEVLTEDGKNLLHLACEQGHSLVLVPLLLYEVDVNALDKDGNSPFHLACKRGYLEVVQTLLRDEQGTRYINVTNKEGNTPLHLACDEGFFDVVKKILKKADHSINTMNEEGNTPLHLAVCGGFQDLAFFLVKKGGNLDLPNKEGSTPCMLAYAKQHIELGTELTSMQRRHQQTRPCTLHTSAHQTWSGFPTGPMAVHPGIQSQPPVAANPNQGPWMTPELRTQLVAMQPPHLHQSTTLPVHKPTYQIYHPAQFTVPPTVATLQPPYSGGGLREMHPEQLPPIPPTVATLQPPYSGGGFQEMHPEQLPPIPPIEPPLLPYHAQSLLPHPTVPPSMQSGFHPVVSSTAGYQVAATAPAHSLQPSTLSGPLDTLWTTVSATSLRTSYSDVPLQESPLPRRTSQTADIKPKVKQPSPEEKKPSLVDIKPKMEMLPKELEGFKIEPKEEVGEDVKLKQVFSDVDKGDLMEELAAKNKLLLDTISQLKEQIAEKDNEINERGNQIAEKDEKIDEIDKQIAKKDQQIAEKDQQILEQDKQNAEQAKQITEQAKQIAEKNEQTVKYQQMYERLMQESQVHSKQPSEQAALTHGGMRTDVTTTEYLRGFETFAETSFVITDSHSHSFEWPRYGLKLHIPEGAVPAELTDCRVDIKAGFTGQFNIPDDLQLVSCVYWLSCPQKFVKPVTLEIEHCASLQDSSQSSSLQFIVAKCSQAELPYQFRMLKKGIFVPRSSYGSIEVSQFSLFGISILKRAWRLWCHPYYSALYYIRNNINNWDVDFVITLHLQAALAAIQDKYSSLYAIPGPGFEVQFESDTIRLAVPEDGVSLQNGWEITPLIAPVIEKQQVDGFKSWKEIPYCRLQVTLDKDRKPVELKHKVKLLGTKSPHDFFTITLSPEGYGEKQARVIAGKRSQLEESGQHRVLKKRCLSDEHVENPPTATSGKRKQLQGQEQGTLVTADVGLLSPNPGTTTYSTRDGVTEGTPSKPKIKDLMDGLYHKVADKWKMIGLYLEIPKGKLAGIAEKCRDNPHRCLVEMLETWLERVHPPVTWTAIIEAVEFLEEEQLGEELRDKYIQ